MFKLLKEIGTFAVASALDNLYPKQKSDRAAAKVECIPEQPVYIPSLQGFAEYAKASTQEEEQYRILLDVLEFGMLPRRFLVTLGKEAVVFSFFLDCDPLFSAMIFTLAREYWGTNAVLGDSFLYREDTGQICMSYEEDFTNVYLHYIKGIVKRSRGKNNNYKNSTELN